MSDSSLQDSGSDALRRSVRSSGLHASTLLRQLHPHPNEALEARMSEEDQAKAKAQLAIYGLLGLAFEDRAERALLSLSKEEDWPWQAFRPGEVSQDGITCSPDILLVPKVDGELRELSLKCTWKSCRKLPVHEEGENEFPLDKFGYYLDQAMCYGTPLDTNSAVLFVYFVNGNYTGARQPHVHGWELDWSHQERAEVWDQLVNIARET